MTPEELIAKAEYVIKPIDAFIRVDAQSAAHAQALALISIAKSLSELVDRGDLTQREM